MNYLLLFFALTSNAIANICMKLGSETYAEGLKKIFTEPMIFFKNGYFFAGIFFFMLGFFLYGLVLARMPLSVAYPIITGLGYLIVISFSVLALGEQLFWWQWIGMALILSGIILLSQSA